MRGAPLEGYLLVMGSFVHQISMHTLVNINKPGLRVGWRSYEHGIQTIQKETDTNC